jgi:hypothetical protein
MGKYILIQKKWLVSWLRRNFLHYTLQPEDNRAEYFFSHLTKMPVLKAQIHVLTLKKKL